jgi:hypothetical protein
MFLFLMLFLFFVFNPALLYVMRLMQNFEGDVEKTVGLLQLS